MPNDQQPSGQDVPKLASAGFAGLAGKRAIVTGGGGGIAVAIATRLAAEGVHLTLADLNLDAATAAADRINAGGGHVSAVDVDVTSATSVDTMFEKAAAFMGGVDILITCAGGYKAYGNFEDLEEDDWDRVIALNLKSVFLCCKAAIPYMKKNGWGRIVNLGSIAGRTTSAGQSPAHYGTAKAGVSMLTQYIAKDVARYGITANTVAPSTTRTDRVVNLLTPDKNEAFTRATPLGYLAEPEDMAGIVLLLASDDARYITGATYDVNGGRMMFI